MSDQNAPGAPGIPGKWTSSAKCGIGKSLSAFSQVTFTLSHGIINEVYYPREDNACTRDMGFLVSDNSGFFSEEKRDTTHDIKTAGPGLPSYTLTNTCIQDRYKICKEIITDPRRSTLLQKVKFTALKGSQADYNLYVLLAPHIGNMASANTAWTGDYKGVPMLFAQRDEVTLALACSSPWLKRSVGYVGRSDGYTDIAENGSMHWEYKLAENGNIALTGEIELDGSGEFILALGFGADENEAAQNARSSLLEGFETAAETFLQEWREWHNQIDDSMLTATLESKALFRSSIAVMRMHEADRFPGGVIASMSIPWGFDKGDDNIGGYHLVWPRDLVECSGAFFAFNTGDDARRVLTYLMATQDESGRWPQNMWLEGKPYWNGLQLDQVAFPILLIDRCRTENQLNAHLEEMCWRCVERAATFLISNGPISPQERWEEESGISISTVAVCIAALLAAASFATERGLKDKATYLLETADYWNSQIENWLYVVDTPIAKNAGVDGYYIRINPDGTPSAELEDKILLLKNRTETDRAIKLTHLVSVDALALVRFGLRDALDPKIVYTVQVIDQLLKSDTPAGPCWRRYVKDGYGEQTDGSPYNGTGIGRPWPLLTGERAHYELAAGDREKAIELLQTMERFAVHDLLPEQIWDGPEIPERDLYPGCPTGSALPLVWAHAEYVKLCASVAANKIFDLPGHTVNRYITNKTTSMLSIWHFELACNRVSKGTALRLETKALADVIWSADDWQTSSRQSAKDSGLGIFYIDLPSTSLTGPSVVFTFYWPDARRWEGKNFTLPVEQ